MYNFYEYFNISSDATTEKILKAYKNKIRSFNKYPKLSERQKYEIKMSKIGLFILTNSQLRKNYNRLINVNPLIDDNIIINKSETNMDSLFDIDNSWKENIKINIDSKKNKIESQILSDRVFSIPIQSNKH